MKPYRELTRRGRLRRLRIQQWALAAYGLDDASLRFIQHGENAIYRVDAPGSDALAAETGRTSRAAMCCASTPWTTRKPLPRSSPG